MFRVVACVAATFYVADGLLQGHTSLMGYSNTPRPTFPRNLVRAAGGGGRPMRGGQGKSRQQRGQSNKEEGLTTSERLQKVIAHAGVASRRAAEEMITDGRVIVNDRLCTDLGRRVNPVSDRVSADSPMVSIAIVTNGNRSSHLPCEAHFNLFPTGRAAIRSKWTARPSACGPRPNLNGCGTSVVLSLLSLPITRRLARFAGPPTPIALLPIRAFVMLLTPTPRSRLCCTNLRAP